MYYKAPELQVGMMFVWLLKSVSELLTLLIITHGLNIFS